MHFTYDAQGRRVRQVGNIYYYDEGEADYIWGDDSDWQYVYDGFQLLGTFDHTAEYPWEMFVWGLDASGTRGGAGGVGGLLMAFLPPMDYEDPPPEEERRVFYGYDANGNVVDLIHNATGAWRGGYEYDAFGRTVHIHGDNVARWHNPMRFSTKYLIASEEGYQMTRWYDYGLRLYYPDLARFTSQDPIGEAGGLNLYAMCGNDLVSKIDPFGFSDTQNCNKIINSLKISKTAIENALRSAAGPCSNSGMSFADLFEGSFNAFENANGFVSTGVGILSAQVLATSGQSASSTRLGGLTHYAGSFSPEQGRLLGRVGGTLTGVGIAVDVGQGIYAGSQGDWGGVSSSVGSAGLGTVGLVIANSNPYTATVAAVGGILIGVAEQSALKMLEVKDAQAQKTYCEEQAARGKQATEAFVQMLKNAASCGCDISTLFKAP